jgi:hypothetical protein
MKKILIFAGCFLFAIIVFAPQCKAQAPAFPDQDSFIKAAKDTNSVENKKLNEVVRLKIQNAELKTKLAVAGGGKNTGAESVQKEKLLKLFDDTDNLLYDPENEDSASKIRADSAISGEVRRLFSLFEKKYPGVYLKIGKVRIASNQVSIYYYINGSYVSFADSSLLHSFTILNGEVRARKVIGRTHDFEYLEGYDFEGEEKTLFDPFARRNN